MIEQGHPDAAAHGHEPIEANVRAVYITGAVMAAVVAASFLLMLGLLGLFSETTGGVPASQFTTPNPGSLLAQQLQQLRAKERELLEEYRWVNQDAGIARIPIERAMEIVAEQGLSGPGETSETVTTAPVDAPPRTEERQP
jgi:hypothetical protein